MLSYWLLYFSYLPVLTLSPAIATYSSSVSSSHPPSEWIVPIVVSAFRCTSSWSTTSVPLLSAFCLLYSLSSSLLSLVPLFLLFPLFLYLGHFFFLFAFVLSLSALLYCCHYFGSWIVWFWITSFLPYHKISYRYTTDRILEALGRFCDCVV